MNIYKRNTLGRCYACGNRVELGVIFEHYDHSFWAIILCSKCIEIAEQVIFTKSNESIDEPEEKI